MAWGSNTTVYRGKWAFKHILLSGKYHFISDKITRSIVSLISKKDTWSQWVEKLTNCINNTELHSGFIVFLGDMVLEIRFSRISYSYSTSCPQFSSLSFLRSSCPHVSSQLECRHITMGRGFSGFFSLSLFFKSRTASRSCQQIKLNWSLLQCLHSTQTYKWCWQLSRRPRGIFAAWGIVKKAGLDLSAEAGSNKTLNTRNTKIQKNHPSQEKSALIYIFNIHLSCHFKHEHKHNINICNCYICDNL